TLFPYTTLFRSRPPSRLLRAVPIRNSPVGIRLIGAPSLPVTVGRSSLGSATRGAARIKPPRSKVHIRQRKGINAPLSSSRHGKLSLSTGQGSVKDSGEDMGPNVVASPSDGHGCSGLCLAFSVDHEH